MATRDFEEKRINGGTIAPKALNAEDKRLRPDLVISWTARDAEDARTGTHAH